MMSDWRGYFATGVLAGLVLAIFAILFLNGTAGAVVRMVGVGLPLVALGLWWLRRHAQRASKPSKT
jgi:hypothetical protein